MRLRNLLSVLALFGLAFAFAARAEDLAGKPSAPMPICANCHEQQAESIVFTAHGAKNDANGSMCQACHGDASEHLKDPMKAKPANPFSKSHPAPLPSRRPSA